MLKISAPFRTKEEVAPLIEAGAGQLYCGYLSPHWRERFTDLEFERKGADSNFTDITALRQAVQQSHARKVPVFLALNGLYVNCQYALLKEIVEDMEDIGFDAYIVADLGLLLALRKWGVKRDIHLSTGATVFNSETVDFYRGLGVRHIVFDRQVTLAQMRMMAEKNPDIHFEAFILNTLCVYIDGFCTFLHLYGSAVGDKIARGGQKSVDVLSKYDPRAQADACCLNYGCSVLGAKPAGDKGSKDVLPTFYKKLVDGPECGACALYDMVSAGIKSVKIVGRQLSCDQRLQSIKFIRASLDVLTEAKRISRSDFIQSVQSLYRETYGIKKPCLGNNCYYPDVLWGRKK